MKLKSGCIFWPQIYQGPNLEFSSLTRDIQCDVLIIGGGITGALAAYHLVREGIHVVLVDRRIVAEGSTAASTGLLQYEIDTPLVELIETIGRDRAVAAYRASLEALLAFEPLVSELGDRCGLHARPSLYLASSEEDVAALRAECEARRAMQIEVEFFERELLKETFRLSRPAALWSTHAAEVDPYRLTLQLIRRSVDLGLDVFTQTEIVSHELRDAGVMLQTSSGLRIDAKKVILAGGYEMSDVLPPDLARLISTYALASEPLAHLDGWPDRCLIWESSRPYLYMRTTEDDRAIVGGEDEEIIDPKLRDQLIKRKAEALARRFSSLFPQIDLDTTCAWAGTFAETKDGLPYIGTHRNFPHGYFALGYGGNGITFSLLAAQLFRDAFLGRAKGNIHADLFGFER